MFEKKITYFGNRDFLFLFLIFTITRIIFAHFLPLGVDEAYQITVGRELDWSYYDHPPLSFWLPSIFSKMFGSEAIIIYRLPSIIFGCITIYALYGIGIQIRGINTAFWSALLYCVSPFFFFSGGIFVLPDAPLNAAICMTLYLFIKSQNIKTNYNFQLIMIGIWVAISFLSKYQSILVPISLLVYFLSSKKRIYWIFHSQIWIIALIGFLGILPILIWNYSEDWPTFAFHGARAKSEISLSNFAKMFLGQLVYLSPPIIISSIWAFFAVNKSERINFLFYPSLFIIIGFNILFLFGANGFPHWTMSGWMLALPLVGVLLDQRGALFEKKFKRWLIAFLVPIWILICAVAVHVNTGWLTADIKPPPRWDNTLQFMRWDEFESKFDAVCCDEKLTKIGFLNWVDAALLGVVLKEQYSIRVINDDPHHFRYLDTDSEPMMGYLLVPVLEMESTESINQILPKIRALDPKAKYLRSISVKRGTEIYANVLMFKMFLPVQKF